MELQPVNSETGKKIIKKIGQRISRGTIKSEQMKLVNKKNKQVVRAINTKNNY